MSRQPRSGDGLTAVLRQAGLQRHEQALRSRGIVNCTCLSALSSRHYASYGITSSDDQRHLAKMIRVIRSVIKDKAASYVDNTSMTGCDPDQRKRYRRTCLESPSNPEETVASDHVEMNVTGPRSKTVDPSTNCRSLSVGSSMHRPSWFECTDHVITGSANETPTPANDCRLIEFSNCPVKLKKPVKTKVFTSPAFVDMAFHRNGNHSTSIDVQFNSNVSNGSDVFPLPRCSESMVLIAEQLARDTGIRQTLTNCDRTCSTGFKHVSHRASGNSSQRHSTTTTTIQPEVPTIVAAKRNSGAIYTDNSVAEGNAVGRIHNSAVTSKVARFQRHGDVTKADHPARLETIYHTDGYNYGVPPRNPTGSRTSTPRLIGRSFPRLTADTPLDRIRVCIRKRPRTASEINKNDPDIIRVQGSRSIIVEDLKTSLDGKKFIQQHVLMFDEVFDEQCDNRRVYASTLQPVVSTLFHSGSAVCFAFGQTGAGKTHTLLGTKLHPGLYRLAAGDLFSMMRQYDGQLTAIVSYYEIYCNRLYDLLNKRKRLNVREDGRSNVCVSDLAEHKVNSIDYLVQLIRHGNRYRRSGSTSVNPVSSRSHALLQLQVKNSCNQIIARLTFVDLAGSERAADAINSDQKTRFEGAEINQSLLALKECIRSLDQSSKHTPYRQSKLTHLLRDSFLGNSQTIMIANVAPTRSSCDNTLNTLRYADRVQEIKKDVARKRMKKAANVEDGIVSSPPPSPRSIASFCSSRSIFPATPTSALSPRSLSSAYKLSSRLTKTPIVSARRRSPKSAANDDDGETPKRTSLINQHLESRDLSYDFLRDLDQFPMSDRNTSSADRRRDEPEVYSADVRVDPFYKNNDTRKSREKTEVLFGEDSHMIDYDARWQQCIETERHGHVEREESHEERRSDIASIAVSTSPDLAEIKRTTTINEHRNSSAGVTSPTASCRNLNSCVIKLGWKSRDEETSGTHVSLREARELSGTRRDSTRRPEVIPSSVQIKRMRSAVDSGLEHQTTCSFYTIPREEITGHTAVKMTSLDTSNTSEHWKRVPRDEGRITCSPWSRDQSCPIDGREPIDLSSAKTRVQVRRSSILGDTTSCGGDLWRSPRMDDVRGSLESDPLEIHKLTPVPTKVSSSLERPCSANKRPCSSDQRACTSVKHSRGAENTETSIGCSGRLEETTLTTKTATPVMNMDDENQMRVLWSRSHSNNIASADGSFCTLPISVACSKHRTHSPDEMLSKMQENANSKKKPSTLVPRASCSMGMIATFDSHVPIYRQFVVDQGEWIRCSSPHNINFTSGVGACLSRSHEQMPQRYLRPTETTDRSRSTPGNVTCYGQLSKISTYRSRGRSPRESTRCSPRSLSSPRRSLRRRETGHGGMKDSRTLNAEESSSVKPSFVLASSIWNQIDKSKKITGKRPSGRPVSPLMLKISTKENRTNSAAVESKANTVTAKIERNVTTIGSDAKVVWNIDAWRRQGQMTTGSINVIPSSIKRSATPEMFVELSARIADLMTRQEKLERASELSLNILSRMAAQEVDRESTSVVVSPSLPAVATVSTVMSRVDCGVQVGLGLLGNSNTTDQLVSALCDASSTLPSMESSAFSQPDSTPPVEQVCSQCGTTEASPATGKRRKCNKERGSVDNLHTIQGDITQLTGRSPRVRINDTVECLDYSANADIASCRRTNVLVDVAAKSSMSMSAFDLISLDVGRVVHAVRGSSSLEDVGFSGVVMLDFARWCQSAAEGGDVQEMYSPTLQSGHSGHEVGDRCVSDTEVKFVRKTRAFLPVTEDDVKLADCSTCRCSSRTQRYRKVTANIGSSAGDNVEAEKSIGTREKGLKPCRKQRIEFKLASKPRIREVCSVSYCRSPASADIPTSYPDSSRKCSRQSTRDVSEDGRSCSLIRRCGRRRSTQGDSSSTESSESRQSSIKTPSGTVPRSTRNTRVMMSAGRMTGVVGDGELAHNESIENKKSERYEEDVFTDQSDFLISSHESQLHILTRLCKKEKHLLHDVKSGHVDFDDYVDNTKVLLSQKAKTIEAFVRNISEYR